MEAWGFKYSSMAFTWIKLNPRADGMFLYRGEGVSGKGGSFHIGMGHTTRKNAEFVLLGRRGAPKRQVKNIHEIIIAPRREHSRKPPDCQERIEAYAQGPYLELFAREARAGWDAWGNQTDKFVEAAE
jgi:N6-adenosine-specific RNA methylase IME4